jgi:hypothetical protein
LVPVLPADRHKRRDRTLAVKSNSIRSPPPPVALMLIG